MDTGCAQLAGWRAASVRQVGDEGAPGYAPWFTVPAAGAVAQAVFTFAWHLARCQASAARLLLGMPAASVRELAAYTLGQVRALALRHPHWLRPRWTSHPLMWRELFAAAASGEPQRLERARLRGQTLIAAEARQCEAGPAAAARRGLRPPRVTREAADSYVRF
jgi:hypothetical protein